MTRLNRGEVVMEMSFAWNGWPYTVMLKFKPETESAIIEDIANEAEAIIRKMKPELGVLIQYKYQGPASRVVFVDLTNESSTT
jgi:hypothetical protein